MTDTSPPSTPPTTALDNPDFIALCTVLGGAAVALTGTEIAQATFLREAGNYAVVSVFDATANFALLVALLFVLGGYLAASVIMVLSPRDPAIIPMRVAAGGLFNGVLGFLLLVLLALVWSGGRYVAMAGALLAAYYGARRATAFRRPKPPFRLALARTALMGLALALGTVLLTYKPNGFPGADAPTAERQAWAQATFKQPYALAVAYLESCPAVSERLGTVKAVAPAAGPNRVVIGPHERVAEFTLEVVGAHGQSLMRLEGKQPKGQGATSKSWTLSANWQEGAKQVPVNCR